MKEGGASRLVKSGLGSTAALREVADDLEKETVPFLPRELRKWADGSHRGQRRSSKEAPWSMPRCVRHMHISCTFF